MTRFCSQCGNQLSDTAAFCGQCGATVSAAAQPAPPSQPAPPPPPPVQPQAAPQPAPQPAPAYAPAYAPAAAPRGNGALIWVLVGGVILILAAAVAWLLFHRQAPAGTAVVDDAAPAASASATGTAATAPAAPAAPAAAAAVAPPPANAAQGPEITKYVTSVANIRNMPTAQDAASRVVGRLQPGTAVRGTVYPGTVPSTYWLRLSDGRGWVSLQNLSDVAGAAPPRVAAAAPDIWGYCIAKTKEGNLRIRATPGGRVVGAIPPGGRFAQIGDTTPDGQWIQVMLNNQTRPAGWVAADYVECN